MLASHSFQGFLPRRTLIMRKKGIASALQSAEPLRPSRIVFVGERAAGELLDKMIAAMGLKRDDVHVLEGPLGDPEFERRLDEAQPEIVVALGQPGPERGRFRDHRGIRLMPTWHPADLLARPSLKKEAWTDLQMVARALGSLN